MPIHDVDWSQLSHAYGPATDVPVLWEAFVRAEPDALDSLAAAVCHQGDVFTATHALVPFLVERARCEGDPVRAEALELLAVIMEGQGLLELGALRAREPIRLRHPSTGATVLHGGAGTGPDPAALAHERAWADAMKREIGSHLDAWCALASHPDERICAAAGALVATIERSRADP